MWWEDSFDPRRAEGFVEAMRAALGPARVDTAARDGEKALPHEAVAEELRKRNRALSHLNDLSRDCETRGRAGRWCVAHMNDVLCIVEPEVVDELSVLGECLSSDACV
jgi:hypothetical protein